MFASLFLKVEQVLHSYLVDARHGVEGFQFGRAFSLLDIADRHAIHVKQVADFFLG